LKVALTPRAKELGGNRRNSGGGLPACNAVTALALASRCAASLVFIMASLCAKVGSMTEVFNAFLLEFLLLGSAAFCGSTGCSKGEGSQSDHLIDARGSPSMSIARPICDFHLPSSTAVMFLKKISEPRLTTA